MKQVRSVQKCGTLGVKFGPLSHCKHDNTALPLRFLWCSLSGHCQSCRQILPAVVSWQVPWTSPEPPRQNLSCETKRLTLLLCHGFHAILQLL